MDGRECRQTSGVGRPASRRTPAGAGRPAPPPAAHPRPSLVPARPGGFLAVVALLADRLHRRLCSCNRQRPLAERYGRFLQVSVSKQAYCKLCQTKHAFIGTMPIGTQAGAAVQRGLRPVRRAGVLVAGSPAALTQVPAAGGAGGPHPLPAARPWPLPADPAPAPEGCRSCRSARRFRGLPDGLTTIGPADVPGTAARYQPTSSRPTPTSATAPRRAADPHPSPRKETPCAAGNRSCPTCRPRRRPGGRSW